MRQLNLFFSYFYLPKRPTPITTDSVLINRICSFIQPNFYRVNLKNWLIIFLISFYTVDSFAVVDNIGDTNDGNFTAGQNTLREAIANASAGDTITFGSSISGQTIVIGSELSIAQNLTIDGTGQSISIDANDTRRVFNVSAGNVTFRALHIQGGNAGSGNDGGGINTASGVTLTVDKSTLTGNQAQNGWAINAATGATITITNSTLQGNSELTPVNLGGSIFADDSTTLTIKNTTIAGNTGELAGTGLRIVDATNVSLYNTLIVDNDNTTGGLDDCYSAGGTIAVNTNNLIEVGGMVVAQVALPLW